MEPKPEATATQEPEAAEKKERKKPGPKPKPPAGPLTLTPQEIVIPSQRPTSPYWCGVTKDCPVQTVHAGGLDFPKFIQKHEDDETRPGRRKLTNVKEYGRVHHLTQDEVDKAMTTLKNKVVRTITSVSEERLHGGKPQEVECSRHFIHDMRGTYNRPFAARPGDVPLGRYVYMIRLGKDETPNQAGPSAKTLVRE